MLLYVIIACIFLSTPLHGCIKTVRESIHKQALKKVMIAHAQPTDLLHDCQCPSLQHLVSEKRIFCAVVHTTSKKHYYLFENAEDMKKLVERVRNLRCRFINWYYIDNPESVSV